MVKKSAFWLTVILTALLPLLSGCGGDTSTAVTPIGPLTVPAAENLYIRDSYPRPGDTSMPAERILAFHPTSPQPAALVTLPEGIVSQDHQRLYTALPGSDHTVVSVFDTRTGARVRSFTIPGTYRTSGIGYDSAAISTDGHWLALRQAEKDGKKTTIALVDTEVSKLVRTIRLTGRFDLDALSPAGSTLYLLEHLNDSEGHYYVRAYDTKTDQLVKKIIVDKLATRETEMSGVALARQLSPGGLFAYTLYMDTLHNAAFVHILPLNDTVTDQFWARCIDLPVGRSTADLRYYTLTLASNGTTLYAANAALGVVSKISLNDDLFSDKIEAQGRFNSHEVNLSISDRSRQLYNGSTLLPGPVGGAQNTLYVVGVRGIWALRVSDFHVQAHYLSGQAFSSVAIGADGRTLYGVDPANGIVVLEVATGRLEQVVHGPASTPVGIEWVAY